MAITNLRNIVTLGVLKNGVYPDVYNEEIGYGKENEIDGIDTTPTIFLYYREDGNLYLYRTKERIEINLTNVTAYDETLLFHFTDESDSDIIGKLPITEFKSENIDSLNVVSKEGFKGCEYNVTWVKPQQQYVYILVPLVHSVSSIFINKIYSNGIFNIVGLYVHDEKSYWIYKGQITLNDNLNYNDVEILNIQVFLRTPTVEDLASWSQLQSNIEKIDLQNRNWWALLKSWIIDHKNWIDDKIIEIYKKFNDYVTIQTYENDKESYKGHIKNYDNPHNVTKKQLGLDTVPTDISSLKRSVSALNELLNKKQNTYSEVLNTDSKTIVGAINELLSQIRYTDNVVRSDSIHKIELVHTIPDNMEDGILYVRIPYYDDDHCFVTINAIPNNSKITLINSEGNIIEGYGSATIQCLVQSTINYKVECDGYITKDVYLELGTEDITLDVVLEIPEMKTIIVNSDPLDATIQLYNVDTDILLIEGVGSVIYKTDEILNIKIKVYADDYITQIHEVLLDQSITKNITLEKYASKTSNIVLHILDENGDVLNPYIYDIDNDILLGQAVNGYYTLVGIPNEVINIKFYTDGYLDLIKSFTFGLTDSNSTILMSKISNLKYDYIIYGVDKNNNKIETIKSIQIYENNSWVDKEVSNNQIIYKSEANTDIQVKISAEGYLDQTQIITLTDSKFEIGISMLEDIEIIEKSTITITYQDSIDNSDIENVQLFDSVNGADYVDKGVSSIHVLEYNKGDILKFKAVKNGYKIEEVNYTINDNENIIIKLSKGIGVMIIGYSNNINPQFSVY